MAARGGAPMTLRRRQFLKSSLAGAAAGAVWLKVPSLAQARASAPAMLRMSERPPNYESVRATFTARITPVERFYLRNHFDLPGRRRGLAPQAARAGGEAALALAGRAGA